MPATRGGQRPAASSQLSSRHTTRSRELGPTILACPLVKIQERALQGKHKLGWPWHGIARAPDKLLRVLRTPSVPPGTLDQVPAWVPTWAPLESPVPLVKQQPRTLSLPTIIYLISAGGTGMMM